MKGAALALLLFRHWPHCLIEASELMQLPSNPLSKPKFETVLKSARCHLVGVAEKKKKVPTRLHLFGLSIILKRTRRMQISLSAEDAW